MNISVREGRFNLDARRVTKSTKVQPFLKCFTVNMTVVYKRR